MHKEDCPTTSAPAVLGTVQRGATPTLTRAASHPELFPSYEWFHNRLLDQKWTDCQSVHSRALKAIHSLFGSANNRLVFVEAGIEQHGNASSSMKGRDQIVIQSVFIASHGLQTTGVVYVIHRA